MLVAGIIAEYNPFHSGHAYHIAQTRAAGASHVVAVMSGNTVQRGEFALCRKEVRARAALAHGADLILGLPTPWSCARAQDFARGGVALLQALGVVDWLSFGSECGDGDLLRRAAALAESPGVQSAMRTRIGEGASFARAREEALRDVDPSAAAALRRPNDTLAVEYLSAMDCLGADMRPMAVLRRGAGHDGILPEGKAAEAEKIYPSASELRKIYRSGEEETAPSPELRKISQRGTPVLPGDLTAPWIAEDLTNGRAPVDMARLNAALLARWRTMLPADFARLPDVSEGIEHLLSRAVREGRSPDEILEMACGRRYPRARLRRILFHAFLGIEAADLHGLPPYLAVLGCNEAGRALLNFAKQSATLRIATRTAAIRSLGATAHRIFEVECRAANLMALAMPIPQPCGMEERRQAIYCDEDSFTR